MAHVAGPKAQHLAIRVRATSDVNGSLQGAYLAAAKRSFVTGSNVIRLSTVIADRQCGNPSRHVTPDLAGART